MTNRRNGRDWIGSLTDLAVQAPDYYKIASTIGQHRRRRRTAQIARRAGWVGVGALVGAGVTALLTPKTGPQIRRRLSEQAGRVRDYVKRPIAERGSDGVQADASRTGSARAES